jgi:hypothetical protein
MRQLTAIDALFLAGENDRTQGRVSALGVYDAVTASGRPLDAAAPATPRISRSSG